MTKQRETSYSPSPSPLRVPPLRFYSKSAKCTLGLSRNGAGLEDPVRGGAPTAVPASGRNSRASRVRGAREESTHAHTKVLAARSDYFRNSKSSNRRVVAFYVSLPVFANKSAFNEVSSVMSIGGDLGSMAMPMGPGVLGT